MGVDGSESSSATLNEKNHGCWGAPLEWGGNQGVVACATHKKVKKQFGEMISHIVRVSDTGSQPPLFEMKERVPSIDSKPACRNLIFRGKRTLVSWSPTVVPPDHAALYLRTMLMATIK